MSTFLSETEYYTFSDVLLVPGYSDFLPKDTNTETILTKNISLKIPIVSAAMDTVTEAELARFMAQSGGIGIIHKNLDPYLQAKHVKMVKRFESYVVFDPVVVSCEDTIKDALRLMKNHNISGLPVVDQESKVVGILTRRDVRFLDHAEEGKKVREFMTSENLVKAKKHTSQKELQALFKKTKVEKIIVVDDNDKCVGLITVKDIEKISTINQASRDKQGRLVVGAAVSTGDESKKRTDILVDVGVDVIVVDSAHGHSKGVLDMVEWIKAKYGDRVDVIGGNVVTAEGTKALIEAGADAVKVGVGPGSICTTRVVAGVGFPQLSAIVGCYNEAIKHGIPIIGDGGIQSSGDLAKAIAGGASTVMLGNLLAGTDESPGQVIMYQGHPYKIYRGMGSVNAMSKGSADRYFQDSNMTKNKLVPQGVEGRVPYKGSLNNILFQLVGGLKASMGYTGNKTIREMQTNCKFIKISVATNKENHPHSIAITENPSNYWF